MENFSVDISHKEQVGLPRITRTTWNPNSSGAVENQARIIADLEAEAKQIELKENSVGDTLLGLKEAVQKLHQRVLELEVRAQR